ncbi:MAG: hypothetical protein LBI42_05900 [Chitinispirillales bacterium]|jgi:hypothetical protein|nr:hypothetical protein [Chitinispirillales bacterium]
MMKRVRGSSKMRFLSVVAAAVFSTLVFIGCEKSPVGPDDDPGNVVSPPVDVPVAGKTVSQILDDGHSALKRNQYDTAMAYYEAAYAKENNNPEAIIYSSLAKLALISIDPKVADLFRNRMGFTSYPNRFNALLSSDWLTYESSLPGLVTPSWVSKGNNSIYNGSLINGAPSVETWVILLLANLVDKNTNGLNGFLDDMIAAVFGTSFTEVNIRIAKLNVNNSNTKITLNSVFLEALNFENIIGEYDEIGWAEANAVLSFMTGIKASMEWVASYDWNTSLNFLKQVWSDNINDLGPYELINSIDAKDLPFNNNFLKARVGKMDAAKASFIKSVEGLQASYEAISTDSKYPASIKNAYPTLNDGANKLVTAIKNGTVFYISDNPTNGTWPTSGNGINMGKLFQPGYFSLQNLFEVDAAGKPVFYTEGVKLTKDNYQELLSENGYAALKVKTSHAAAVVVPAQSQGDEMFELPFFLALWLFEKYNGLPLTNLYVLEKKQPLAKALIRKK